MPLILSETHPTFGQTYLWHTTEDDSFYVSRLDLPPEIITKVQSWHPRRQKEWLSSRYLIHACGKYDLADLYKDEHGKPRLKSGLDHLSISHTTDLSALTIATHTIGIDIQLTTPKVHRISHKFASPDELDLCCKHYTLDEALHMIWGIKEAVFKAYGRGGVSYLSHIKIIDVTKHLGAVHCHITFLKPSEQRQYHGRVRKIGDYFWSQVVLLT